MNEVIPALGEERLWEGMGGMGGLALLRAKVGAECGAGIHTGKDGRVEQEGVWKGAACKRWQPFEWPGPGMFWPKWHIWWERRNHNKQPLQQASMNTLWTSSPAELWHAHTFSGSVCGKCFAAARTCNVKFPALRHTVNEKQVEVIHVYYLG